jgi:hypothetical protein
MHGIEDGERGTKLLRCANGNRASYVQKVEDRQFVAQARKAPQTEG